MKKLLLIICCIFFASCKTYTISPDSFRQQFIANNKSGSEVTINNPMTYAGTITYKANDIKWIKVINKEGQEETIQNSPSLEMKVTTKSGKNYYMYFDTVFLENDTLYAERSRLLYLKKRAIHFDSIQKIEIQDGGKKFNHQ